MAKRNPEGPKGQRVRTEAEMDAEFLLENNLEQALAELQKAQDEAIATFLKYRGSRSNTAVATLRKDLEDVMACIAMLQACPIQEIMRRMDGFKKLAQELSNLSDGE